MVNMNYLYIILGYSILHFIYSEIFDIHPLRMYL
jgi:hypothetical protein